MIRIWPSMAAKRATMSAKDATQKLHPKLHIFFCAPLLRQLPLRSLLCLSLLCTDAQAAQLGSSSCASPALRLHVATAIPSDCSEN